MKIASEKINMVFWGLVMEERGSDPQPSPPWLRHCLLALLFVPVDASVYLLVPVCTCLYGICSYWCQCASTGIYLVVLFPVTLGVSVFLPAVQVYEMFSWQGCIIEDKFLERATKRSA